MKIEILSTVDGVIKRTDITYYCEIDVSELQRMGSELDTFTFTFSPTTKEECLEPGTCIRVTFNDGTQEDYAVVSDVSKIASKGTTPTYTHEVQCVQYARRLCYKLIRGTDLSQPYNSPRKSAVLNQVFSLYYADGTLPYDNLTYERALGTTKADGFPFEYVKPGGKVTMGAYKLVNSSEQDHDYDVVAVDSVKAPSIVSYTDTSTIVIVELTDLTGNGKTHVITAEEADAINLYIKQGYDIRLQNVTQSANFNGQLIDPSGDKDKRDYPQAYVWLRYDTDTYRYTFRDVLEKIAHNATTEYKIKSDGAWYTKQGELPFTVAERSTGLSSAILDSTAPDFQFQQNTSVYDAVAEVLKVLGGKPTLSYENVLGIKFFNERSTEITKDNFIDEMRTVNDSKRTNAVVLPYQNGTPRAVTEHPTNFGSTVRYTNATPKELGIPSATDYWLMTNTLIYQVRSFIVPLSKGFDLQANVLARSGSAIGPKVVNWTPGMDLDIIDFIFDSDTYSLLDTNRDYHGKYIAYKENSLVYTIGDNAIAVGKQYQDTSNKTYYIYPRCVESALMRLLGGEGATYPFRNDSSYESAGLPKDRPQEWRMKCSYYPITSGNVRVESPIEKNYGDLTESEIVVAQKSGIISLEKLGVSALGSVSMLGEETMTATYRAYTYTDKKPLAGMWLKDGTDYWIVQDAKSTQLIDGTYKAVLTLSKGFNKVSDRVQIDRNLRMTEISKNLVLKSEVMLKDYIYITNGGVPFTLLTGDGALGNYTMLTGDGFAKLAGCAFNATYGSKAYQKAIIFHQEGAVQGFVAPTSCYASGNAVCFEGNFDNPTSARNYFYDDDGTYYAKATAYAKDGWLRQFDISVIDEEASVEMVDGSDPWLKPDQVTQSGVTINTYFDMEYAGKIMGACRIDALKTPNDILGFNYQVFYLPYKGNANPMIIYPGLASHCPYVSGTPKRSLKLYFNTSTMPYSQFETAPRGTFISENVDFAVAKPSIIIPVKKCLMAMARNGTSGEDYIKTTYAINGWLLTDDQGVPLLASNQALASGNQIQFHLFASHKRL